MRKNYYTCVEHYKLIGSGTFGKVYKTKNINDSSVEVAIKVIEK